MAAPKSQPKTTEEQAQEEALRNQNVSGKVETETSNVPGTAPAESGRLTGSPDDDPTKFGSAVDMTPLNTRSAGQVEAGLSDADLGLAGYEQGERRSTGKGLSENVTELQTEGGEGVLDLDVEKLTPEQAKAILRTYGVDAPAAQAQELLADALQKGKDAGAKTVK